MEKKKAASVNIVIKQNVVFLIVGEESPKLPRGKKLEQTDLQENNPWKIHRDVLMMHQIILSGFIILWASAIS